MSRFIYLPVALLEFLLPVIIECLPFNQTQSALAQNSSPASPSIYTLPTQGKITCKEIYYRTFPSSLAADKQKLVKPTNGIDNTTEGLFALILFGSLSLGLCGYKKYSTVRAVCLARKIENLEKLWKIDV